MSDVVTGEAVALDLRIAQLPSRIVAAAIDFGVMLVVLYALIGVGGQLVGRNAIDPALAGALSVVIVVAIFLGYPVVFETLSRGRTLGKIAMGLRVVRDDGGPIFFRHALVRGLVGLTLERPGLFLLGLGPALGMVVSMFSTNGKRIGDMAAGTMVLQERVSVRPPWVPWMPGPLVGWASTLDLTGLDDSLALSVRQFLGRANQFDPNAREALGRQLSAEVRQQTTPPPPVGTPGWAYLSAVLAERRRREELRMVAHSNAAGHPGPRLAGSRLPASEHPSPSAHPAWPYPGPGAPQVPGYPAPPQGSPPARYGDPTRPYGHPPTPYGSPPQPYGWPPPPGRHAPPPYG